MQDTVLFAFRDDPLCFVHVLLNALDLDAKGARAGIVLEGGATRLAGPMAEAGHFLNPLYRKARERGLLFGACRACSNKLGALAAVEALGLPLLDDMSGHPSIAGYQAQGYAVLIF
ncbi:hypothetical protein SAMN04488503_0883 [Humidesulfovibrio mexicanus]|uniref:DsrE/DsrF-like family protein n=1 Tax=Humidesulfovibrio mexicanus TaxID=147047 RepID=A0A238YCR0_9BACT|nr:cytoplasmic protein [Humidesulfovibrio mexicanus]SNR69015.1 hypothetical protein SAMN04488503_0883 [Humidesulfovibrio mexicanus]